MYVGRFKMDQADVCELQATALFTSCRVLLSKRETRYLLRSLTFRPIKSMREFASCPLAMTHQRLTRTGRTLLLK